PRSAAVLGWAAAVAGVAFMALDAAWGSARLGVWLLAVVALVGAFLVSLPGWGGRYFASRGRSEKQAEQVRGQGTFVGRMITRGIVSVFVLIHFTGIFSSFMSAPIPARDTSWLALWVNTIVQPYLQFAYLTNAYRFYSPEPGPASLLWYYVEYSDGSSRRLRIPTREEHDLDPLGQEYTRRLSLGTNVEQQVPLPRVPPQVLQRRLVA